MNCCNFKKYDLVVLFSGGADSTLLLKIAEKTGRVPYAVLIDYGQLHVKELDFAEKFLSDNKIEYSKIKISGYNVNSGLTGTGEKGIYDGVHSHNVPARNSIFLSLACGIAESKNIEEVWWGADWSDANSGFPDCTQEYAIRMNKVFEISGVRPISIKAPLLGFSKEMVLEMLESYGIKKEEIFSGYGEFS